MSFFKPAGRAMEQAKRASDTVRKASEPAWGAGAKEIQGLEVEGVAGGREQ